MTQLSKRFITGVFLICVVYLSILYPIVLFFILIMINYFSINEFNFIFKKIFKQKKLLYFLSILISLIYTGTFSLVVWLFISQSHGINVKVIIFLIIVIASTDIGGFIFGKLIGGYKITKISPNKTYSGVVGSFICSSICGFIFYKLFLQSINFQINIFILLILISSTSQIGDLMISFLKRKAKVKDTGKILPGHGGILDRIDGILLALPVGIILASI